MVRPRFNGALPQPVGVSAPIQCVRMEMGWKEMIRQSNGPSRTALPAAHRSTSSKPRELRMNERLSRGEGNGGGGLMCAYSNRLPLLKGPFETNEGH